MKIFLLNQTPKMTQHLDFFKRQEVMAFSKPDLVEKESRITISTDLGIQELDLNFLFDYQIFPNNIIEGYCEWLVEKKQMEVGDTIVQQAFLPPSRTFSQKVIFGVRISEVINEGSRRGYSYKTLEGHVEKGVSTFTIEKKEGKTEFVIRTFSKPGNFLTRLLGPIFSIPYQTYCTKSALRNVKRKIEQQKKQF